MLLPPRQHFSQTLFTAGLSVCPRCLASIVERSSQSLLSCPVLSCSSTTTDAFNLIMDERISTARVAFRRLSPALACLTNTMTLNGVKQLRGQFEARVQRRNQTKRNFVPFCGEPSRHRHEVPSVATSLCYFIIVVRMIGVAERGADRVQLHSIVPLPSGDQ